MKKRVKNALLYMAKFIAIMVLFAIAISSFTSCTIDYHAKKDTEIPFAVINQSDDIIYKIDDTMMCPEYSIVHDNYLYVFKYDWDMHYTILKYKVDLHNYHWMYIFCIFLFVTFFIIFIEIKKKKKELPF